MEKNKNGMKKYSFTLMNSLDENFIRDTFMAKDVIDAYEHTLNVLNMINEKVPKGKAKFEIANIEAV